MREIKFRTWDGERLTYDPFIGEQTFTEFVREVQANSPDAVVEQFTGLKDKNSMEIYEGDIVRLNDEVFEVRYAAPHFAIFSKEQEEDAMYASPIYEVIGNIHQNPELLK